MSWFIPALVLLVVAAPFLWHRLRSNKLPPGPPGLPFIGNWFDLRHKSLPRQLTQWATQFGDIYSYKNGPRAVVVLSSPSVLEDLCVKKGHVYSSRPRLSKQADLCTKALRVLNMEYGDMWRKHRKIVHQLLGMHNSKIFMPYQEFETRAMLVNLLDEPESFYHEVERYSASVTFSLLLGARFPKADHPIIHRIDTQLRIFFAHVSYGKWLVDWLPFLDLLPEPLAPWRGKARRFYHEHISFWLAFYTQIKVRVEAGTAPECFMSKLLQENDIRSQLTDEEATGLMASLLSAGSETTATALKWFFKACTKYPDFIRSAQEEIDRVVGRERMPDWADRDKMPYLNAVIKELHRWSSLAPLAFQHATTGDDKYRGWNIPSGTVIVPNTYAIHHSVEFFPEHEKFIPERFLPPGDKRHALGLARIDHHYNFGIGRRVCPGQHVADASLFIGISRLLWTFNIGLKKGGFVDDKTVGAPPVIGPAPFECSITPKSPEIVDIARRSAEKMGQSGMEDAALYERYLIGIL